MIPRHGKKHQPDNADMFRAMTARAEAAEQQAADLAAALLMAHQHISELREAWTRGVIQESDGSGGTRSNRNRDVQHAITVALTAYEAGK